MAMEYNITSKIKRGNSASNSNSKHDLVRCNKI